MDTGFCLASKAQKKPPSPVGKKEGENRKFQEKHVKLREVKEGDKIKKRDLPLRVFDIESEILTNASFGNIGNIGEQETFN